MSETSPQSIAAPAVPPASGQPPPARGPGVLQLGVVVAILAAGILLTSVLSEVTRVSEPGIRLVDDHPFLPETAGAWKGGEQTGLTEEERTILPPDTEGVRRAYKDAAGHSVYCSVVMAGRDVTSIHRPDVCLQGQGWQLEPPTTERVETPVARDGVLRVARMNGTSKIRMKDGNSVQAYAVFVYWFVGKDRTTPSHWRRILWTTFDRVLHNRNHRWAYFLINVMVPPARTVQNPKEGEDEAMQVVRQFVQDIYPQLTPN